MPIHKIYVCEVALNLAMWKATWMSERILSNWFMNVLISLYWKHLRRKIKWDPFCAVRYSMTSKMKNWRLTFLSVHFRTWVYVLFLCICAMYVRYTYVLPVCFMYVRRACVICAYVLYICAVCCFTYVCSHSFLHISVDAEVVVVDIDSRIHTYWDRLSPYSSDNMCSKSYTKRSDIRMQSSILSDVVGSKCRCNL